MSEWITDRAPTEKDTDKSAIWMVWTTYNGEVIAWTYDGVAKGTPWMPISKPEPYVAPKPWYYVKFLLAEELGKQNRWCVYCNVGGIHSIQADDLPNREAAERIAAIYNEAIYNEVMP